MIEPNTGEPTPVGAGPALLARIDAAMAQEKPLQMLAPLAEHPHRRRPRADEITHRLVRIVGDPDARQLAGPVQLGEHDRVAPIRLHAIARLHRNERRGNYNAVVVKLGELTVEAIAAGPRLIAKAPTALAEPFDQLGDVVRVVRKDTDVT